MNNKNSDVKIDKNIDLNIDKRDLEKLLKSSRIFDFFSIYYDDDKNNEIIDLVKNDIYPLPVVDNDVVIWGFHIINAAVKIGLKTLLCRNIESKKLSKEEKLLFALQCENRSNNYSWDEKEKLYLFIEKELGGRISDSLLPLIQQEGSFINYASIYISLSSLLKNFIKKGIIDLKTAKNCSNITENCLKLMDMPDLSDIPNMPDLLEKYLLTLSFSNRRIFLTNISEIIRRRCYTDVKNILKEENPFDAAFKTRYPELSSCTEKFDKFNSAVLKDSGIKLKHPPYFEGNSYSVEFSFQSKKHLEKIIKRLSDLKEKSDEIFELL